MHFLVSAISHSHSPSARCLVRDFRFFTFGTQYFCFATKPKFSSQIERMIEAVAWPFPDHFQLKQIWRHKLHTHQAHTTSLAIFDNQPAAFCKHSHDARCVFKSKFSAHCGFQPGSCTIRLIRRVSYIAVLVNHFAYLLSLVQLFSDLFKHSKSSWVAGNDIPSSTAAKPTNRCAS